jgi:chromate transporter
MIGDRFQGPAGAIASLLGMMAMPLAIVVSLALVYDRFAAVPEVAAGVTGAAAAAAAASGIRLTFTPNRSARSE